MNVTIFANGEDVLNKNVIERIELLKQKSIIIACDGAVTICKKLNIKPNYIIGDFDSYPKDFEVENCSSCIVEKNQNFTDLQKAINFAKKFNPSKISVFSAFGKRFDHTLANVLIFNFEIPKNIKMEVFDNFGKFFILHSGFHNFSNLIGKTISFFSLSTIRDLKLLGFEYNFFHNGILPYFIGVSNVIKQKDASVSFSNGILIAYILF